MTPVRRALYTYGLPLAAHTLTIIALVIHEATR